MTSFLSIVELAFRYPIKYKRRQNRWFRTNKREVLRNSEKVTQKLLACKQDLVSLSWGAAGENNGWTLPAEGWFEWLGGALAPALWGVASPLAGRPRT